MTGVTPGSTDLKIHGPSLMIQCCLVPEVMRNTMVTPRGAKELCSTRDQLSEGRPLKLKVPDFEVPFKTNTA